MWFKRKEKSVCSCNGACNTTETVSKNTTAQKVEINSIKVLGSGCKNCTVLKLNTENALKELGLNINVEYVKDLQEIMKYGVMSTPALVINEKVISSGKVLSTADIKKIIW